jgi:hypothetical protein
MADYSPCVLDSVCFALRKIERRHNGLLVLAPRPNTLTLTTLYFTPVSNQTVSVIVKIAASVASIGPGSYEEVAINLNGPITPNEPLKCSWAAFGSSGHQCGGFQELSFQ